MNLGLFDALRGEFHEGTPVAAVSEKEHRLYSVMSNLSRLFNTRQGTLEHLPGYGLPEAATIYRDATYPIEDLRRSVREAVERYEPRLRHVQVDRLPEADDEIRVAMLIKAELLDGEQVRFQTTFSTSDLATVTPVRTRG